MQAKQTSPRRRLSITPQAALGAAVLLIFLLLHLAAGAVMLGAAISDGAQLRPASTLRFTD
ncbi:hypothetical protein ACQR1I_36555 [Bradyrhizobium sp. HKCCYLS2038]|uniref:hypothetical protein n=1 Tax=unclassified Bradyrhizobium TaxID=2631580 RepID=UPI003EB6EC6D